jgi:hypothetical protein
MAVDQAPESIAGAEKLPARFGGGFLFWTENSIFRSDAFDSALVPVASMPDRIETISFGPKAIMVRTSNGERWGISLPKGERVPLVPLGLVDAVALDEGRALAFDDRGSVFTSLDHGATWTDATAQVKGKPARVFLHGEELWLEGENSDAMRLEPDGHLSWFDKVPDDPAVELRPRDPRWRGADWSLRAALRSGVAIDDATALVIEGGDVYRIDTRSGDVVSVLSGKLPPDSTCQGMQIPGDVLFACIARSNNASSFVVSHTLSGDGPIIEQTFGQSSASFFASDEGGLAYAGPCSSTALPTVASVCVRMPGGTWEERDLSLLSTDAGVGPSDMSVARWIPHADGRVVAIITDPQPGIYDPSVGVLTPVADEVRTLIGRGTPSYYSGRGPGYRIRYSKHAGGVISLIDSTWTFGTGTTIRGVANDGEAFEILDDGKVKLSPYGFEAIYSFNLGVGRSKKDSRLFQTNDHGATWTEVAAPPTGMEPLEMLACSSVGCDFGAFYRIGWQMRPPNHEPQMKPSPPAPSVRRVRGVELTCRPNGPVVQKALPRTEQSPDDLGLGAVRLPMASEKNDWQYVRNPVPRGIISSWSGVVDAGSSGDGESSTSLRAVFSGYATSKDDNDTLIASGPTKNILSLRRAISYVPAFEPTGRIVRGGLAIADLVSAARRAGMTTDEFLSGDPTENLTPFILTSSDPNAGGDIALYDSSNGVIAAFRGERARVAVRPPNQNGSGAIAFSGVALNADETAILDVDSDTQTSRVYKIGPSGVVDLFDYPANSQYHLANPDALSIGPKNELGIVRTPSGSDPPSPFDPAYLVVQGSAPTQLAAWSTMKLADDPACKSEAGGHRATIQAVGPWIRTTNPDLKVEDAPMIVRVRWTASRVCVEGFELKMPSVKLTIPSGGASVPVTVGSYLVAKGSTIARVAVSEGIEWRQPMECTVASTGP